MMFAERQKEKRRIWFAIVLPLFISCTTLSPVSNEREKPPERNKNIEETFPLWEALGDDSPGLYFYAGKTRSPRLEFWALRADLNNPGLRIVINQSGLSTHVTSFTEEYNCIAGINTNPFDPVSGREGEKRTVIGIAVSGGELKSPPAAGYDALVFYKDGSAAVINQSEISYKDGAALHGVSPIENAAGGFKIILEEGRVSDRLLERDASGGVSSRPRGDLPRHPRSAAGLSDDGRTLYLLVVDGRRPGSKGATEAELALLLKQLGAVRGLNFDGGGSSVLALRFPDGKVRAVNTPIHNMIPGLERGVASCLGIAAGEKQ